MTPAQTTTSRQRTPPRPSIATTATTRFTLAATTSPRAFIPLYIRGGGGTDLVEFEDTLDVPNLDTYVFDHEGLNGTADRFIRPPGTVQGPNVVVTMEGIEQQVLHANEGNSGFQIYNPSMPADQRKRWERFYLRVRHRRAARDQQRRGQRLHRGERE